MRGLRIAGLVLAIILIVKNYGTSIALFMNEQSELAQESMDKGQLYLFLLALVGIIYRRK